MKVLELVERLSPRRSSGSPNTEVKGLHYDSRRVEAGGAFFALRGEKTDGHRFIDQAVERGARIVVMEEERALPPGVASLLVDDARKALALASAAFYGDPTAGIPVVGVTGTNGKTTTTYLVESLLREAGKLPAVLGTINYRFGGRVEPSLHTTPEAPDLLGMVADFRRQGANALVMEVSSHALAQHRVDGVEYSVAVFTNLTPEHLDYHRDMEEYFASKSRLFTELLAPRNGLAVVNIDDPFGSRLASGLEGVLTFGMGPAAQVRPRKVELSLAGIHGILESPQGPIHLRSSLVGGFNLVNLLGAAATGIALGLSPETVARGLSAAPQVPGRMERVENDRGALILVDYAHTGDALDKVLQAARELDPKRVVTLFGCGGDRDRTKRPVMGEVAGRRSDLVVVTSDNPRTEDPLAILEEIRPGVERHFAGELSRQEASAPGARGYLVIQDRREAIAFAASVLQEGELLVVAGKGHEDYQIIGTQRHHFDDREEVRRALTGAGEAHEG